MVLIDHPGAIVSDKALILQNALAQGYWMGASAYHGLHHCAGSDIPYNLDHFQG
jgi:hypothetical protein